MAIRIKLTRGCIVPGHPTAQPGDVLEVANNVAQDLLAIRKAVRVDFVEEVETRVPVVESRDPEPRPKRSKFKTL